MFDEEIFKGKTLANLFSEIYENSKKKDEQINTLIGQLKGLIKNMTDATVIVPLIKDYIDASLKNDDHLIKMAGIVQRAKTRSVADGSDLSLTDDEKNELLETIAAIEEKGRDE